MVQSTPPDPASSGPPSSPSNKSAQTDHADYWKGTLRVVFALLTVWAAISYGAGILFVDFLNQYTLPGTGFPLGFWFAQQGAVFGFVLIVVVYVVVMNRLDRRHGVAED